MLLLVATPIGNLADISPRAKEALAQADRILCEDTRHTGQLMLLLGIEKKRLLSYHKINEAQREQQIMSLLEAGQRVALVSDAGTPCICDPGSRIVDTCHRKNIPVTIIPGPSACVGAYAVSGNLSEKFQFIGFLPRAEVALQACLHEVSMYDGSTVAYESPNRLKKTLQMIAAMNPSWEITVVRELTKRFEQIVRLPVAELKDFFSGDILGEIALVFPQIKKTAPPSDDQIFLEVQTIRDRFACSLTEAVEIVGRTYGLAHRMVYALCVRSKN